MDNSTDISKIIGIIMEHPELIEKIKSFATKETANTESNNNAEAVNAEAVLLTEQAEKANAEVNDAKDSITVSKEDATYKKRYNKKRRNELLCALKPYVSKERSRAIDTMLSVIDVLDIMKEG